MKQINPILIWVVLALLAPSCITTTIYPCLSCRICISDDPGIVILPLTNAAGFSKLSHSGRRAVMHYVETHLKKAGFQKVEHYENLDYDFAVKNIKFDENEIAYGAFMKKDFGYTYYLELSLGEVVDSASDYRKNIEKGREDELIYVPSELYTHLGFKLKETESGDLVAHFIVDAESHEIPFPGSAREGINFGTTWGTIEAGARRGGKYLKKKCKCPEELLRSFEGRVQGQN